MKHSIKQSRVSVLGSSSVTDTDSDVNNRPIGNSWANLAASARDDWGAENPF